MKIVAGFAIAALLLILGAHAISEAEMARWRLERDRRRWRQ